MKTTLKLLFALSLLVALGMGTVRYFELIEARQQREEKERLIEVKKNMGPIEKLGDIPEGQKEFLELALKSPESLHDLEKLKEEPEYSANTSQNSQPVTLDTQMEMDSESEPSDENESQVTLTLKMPSASSGGVVQQPYFQDEFASMRAESIRNPDSPENQALNRAIMTNRQKRLDRNKRAAAKAPEVSDENE